jgi:cysteine-rich repeat protein
VKGMTKSYFDRLSTAKEPVSMKTHAELVGRYAMLYPPGTDATAVYLRILYTNPTKKLSFGIIDVDQGAEKWSIEARDANDVVLVTKHLDADPNSYLAGDGEIRFVDLDVSASGSAMKEVRVQQTGTPGAGLGFDAFSTIDIPTWVCGDSVVAPGEECDDGNKASGDGCSDLCKIEAASSSSSSSGGGGSGGGGGEPGDPPGCGCQVPGRSGGERGLAVIAMGALALLRMRRSGQR